MPAHTGRFVLCLLIYTAMFFISLLHVVVLFPTGWDTGLGTGPPEPLLDLEERVTNCRSCCCLLCGVKRAVEQAPPAGQAAAEDKPRLCSWGWMIKKTFLWPSINPCCTHVPSSPCSLGVFISKALGRSRSGAEEKNGRDQGHEMAFVRKKLNR